MDGKNKRYSFNFQNIKYRTKQQPNLVAPTGKNGPPAVITSEEEISPLVCKHNSSYFHSLCEGILFNSIALDREFINAN